MKLITGRPQYLERLTFLRFDWFGDKYLGQQFYVHKKHASSHIYLSPCEKYVFICFIVGISIFFFYFSWFDVLINSLINHVKVNSYRIGETDFIHFDRLYKLEKKFDSSILLGIALQVRNTMRPVIVQWWKCLAAIAITISITVGK